MKYMVSNQDRPDNTPLYSIHSDLDSFIFYKEDDINEQGAEKQEEIDLSELSNQKKNEERNNQNPSSHEHQHNGESKLETLWNMSFDGSSGKFGSGAGVWIHKTNEGHSYKLYFQCTNNIAEYEALLLGLHLLKNIGAKKISVQGYSEVIIRKIKGEQSAKNPRLRVQKCFLRPPKNI